MNREKVDYDKYDSYFFFSDKLVKLLPKSYTCIRKNYVVVIEERETMMRNQNEISIEE
jgi:hypothetical protein